MSGPLNRSQGLRIKTLSQTLTGTDLLRTVEVVAMGRDGSTTGPPTELDPSIVRALLASVGLKVALGLHSNHDLSQSGGAARIEWATGAPGSMPATFWPLTEDTAASNRLKHDIPFDGKWKVFVLPRTTASGSGPVALFFKMAVKHFTSTKAYEVYPVPVLATQGDKWFTDHHVLGLGVLTTGQKGDVAFETVIIGDPIA
jgi:hypothetical protein